MEQLTRDIVQWLEEKIEIEKKRHDMKMFMINDIPIVDDYSITDRCIHIHSSEALFERIAAYLGVTFDINNRETDEHRIRSFMLDGFEILALFDKEVGKC